MVAARNPEGLYGWCPKCNSGRLHKCATTDDGRKIRYRCSDCKHRTTNPKKAPDPVPKAKFKPTVPGAKIYVFTSAQNATPIHKPFWESLNRFVDYYGAELVIAGYRYRNPTSIWSENMEHDEWWDDAVVPHLYNGRSLINENVEFLGDIFPQATAVKPITGFEAISGSRSCIIGHPKVQLRTVATPADQYPKIITTTGTVTRENYTQTKAGKKGEFHHTFGAVVVEVGEGGAFSMRQISAQKNGAFFDLGPEGVLKFTRDGVEKGHKLAGLIQGDTHVDHVDPGVVAATFENDDSIVSVGDPDWLVWHDLIDLYSRNRYAINPFIEVAKQRDGTDDVRAELERGWKFHDAMARSKKSAIIASNHTNARLDWYMQTADWRKDPVNAEFYFETGLQMLRSLKATEVGHTYEDPFVYWGKKLCKAPNVRFIDVDEHFGIAGIECQYHGHIGPGAAKGASLENMRRIGVKTVFAHVHAPGTEEGAMSAGTSTRLRLGYNAGPSNWMTSHVGIYPNGKRTHLFIMNGRWHHLT